MPSVGSQEISGHGIPPTIFLCLCIIADPRSMMSIMIDQSIQPIVQHYSYHHTAVAQITAPSSQAYFEQTQLAELYIHTRGISRLSEIQILPVRKPPQKATTERMSHRRHNAQESTRKIITAECIQTYIPGGIPHVQLNPVIDQQPQREETVGCIYLCPQEQT
jgi:hypothetical protein